MIEDDRRPSNDVATSSEETSFLVQQHQQANLRLVRCLGVFDGHTASCPPGRAYPGTGDKKMVRVFGAPVSSGKSFNKAFQGPEVGWKEEGAGLGGLEAFPVGLGHISNSI